MARQRDAGIAMSNKRIGTGPIYTLGPAPQLLGLPAPPVAAGAADKAVLDREEMYADYVPDKDLIPMFITGTTVNVVAYIGLIMLAGIVVNQSIVLIDAVNQARERGLDREAAIVEAGRTRLRPILKIGRASCRERV